MNKRPKTLIGILATHDNVQKNEALKTILDTMVGSPEGKEILSEFSFIFTGGTCARLFDGQPCFGQHGNVRHKLKTETQTFLLEECGVVRLPPNDEGGVTILSTLISQRMVSIIWTFFSPLNNPLAFS